MKKMFCDRCNEEIGGMVYPIRLGWYFPYTNYKEVAIGGLSIPPSRAGQSQRTLDLCRSCAIKVDSCIDDA